MTVLRYAEFQIIDSRADGGVFTVATQSGESLFACKSRPEARRALRVLELLPKIASDPQ